MKAAMSQESSPSLNAAIYEAFAGLQDWRGLRRQRRRVGARATGAVLEVGVGTGRNLPYYTRASHVVGIDPDASMLGRAGRRSVNAPCPVDLRIGSAEDLPLPSEHFDTVVATLVLCTIEYPEVALNEFRRVLKPGGRLVFLEHERSPIGSIARLQDLITPFWMRISGGCHLNRSTTGTISQQGFAITDSWRSRGGQGSLVQGAAQLGQS